MNSEKPAMIRVQETIGYVVLFVMLLWVASCWWWVENAAAYLMSRRGRGEGSIGQLKDGRWVARITNVGKREAYYGKTRSEASAKLAVALKRKQDGFPPPTCSWMDEWQIAEGLGNAGSRRVR